MQYSELRWISPVDILDVKQPTRMKFQSVSNYVINYMCIGETFHMLLANVFCKDSVSTDWNVEVTCTSNSFPTTN